MDVHERQFAGRRVTGSGGDGRQWRGCKYTGEHAKLRVWMGDRS